MFQAVQLLMKHGVNASARCHDLNSIDQVAKDCSLEAVRYLLDLAVKVDGVIRHLFVKEKLRVRAASSPCSS
jgi:hypothetical protein